MKDAIILTIAEYQNDLNGILKLQKENLSINLSAEDKISEGFVSVVHTEESITKLNNIAPHVIAKENDEVIAYVLTMTAISKNVIPMLVPMFDLFDSVRYNQLLISEYNYMLVGQVCVSKAYRGSGLFDQIYNAYAKEYKQFYDFAITEIAADNIRSLKAHYRVGFNEIYRYTTNDNFEWVIVLWDWK